MKAPKIGWWLVKSASGTIPIYGVKPRMFAILAGLLHGVKILSGPHATRADALIRRK